VPNPSYKSLDNLRRLGTLAFEAYIGSLDQLFAANGFFDTRDILQLKYEMLRCVAVGGLSIDEATAAFGLPREAFDHAKSDFEQGGVAGLLLVKRDERLHIEMHQQSVDPRDQVEREPSVLDKSEPAKFVSDDLEIDFEARRVRAGNKNVHLTRTEFSLLRQLVWHAGNPVPHRKLLESVWGPGYVDKIASLRVYVNLLRKKLEPDPSNPRYILTEPWIGYRFMASI
jgi:DNA-binding winged helix-turn-helix (wHTH) protein